MCKEAEDLSLLGLYGATAGKGGREGGREGGGEGEGGDWNLENPEFYDEETAQTKEQYLQVGNMSCHAVSCCVHFLSFQLVLSGYRMTVL